MRERLERACGTGEILTIVYRGGTQPGTKRDISPRRVDADIVQALDLATHEIRSFRIDRMEIVTQDSPLPSYVPGSAAGRFHSIAQVHVGLAHELIRLGWHVQATGDRLGLHALTGKGIPSRRAKVTLQRSSSAARPWVVKSPYRFQRSFASLDRAARFLLSEASRHADHVPQPDAGDVTVVQGTLWPQSEQPHAGIWSRLKRALGIGGRRAGSG